MGTQPGGLSKQGSLEKLQAATCWFKRRNARNLCLMPEPYSAHLQSWKKYTPNYLLRGLLIRNKTQKVVHFQQNCEEGGGGRKEEARKRRVGEEGGEGRGRGEKKREKEGEEGRGKGEGGEGSRGQLLGAAGAPGWS